MKDITDIPHDLRSYTATHQTWSLPADLQCEFFLSFEDALWALVDTHGLRGQTILVPNFYCFDVVKNMQAHGLIVQTYRMNKDLTVDREDFKKKIVHQAGKNQTQHVTLKIIVVFHPVGIQSELMESVRDLDENTFVIEDAVHRVVDPSQVKIAHERHFVIDSWRKVMPLQGSMMLRKKLVTGGEFLVSLKDRYSFTTWAYSTKVLSLWLAMVVAAKLRQGKLAQKLMLCGYDVIGDNMQAARPPQVFDRVRKRIDYARLRSIKQNQIQQYEEALHELISSDGRLFPIRFSPSDWAEMRAYPVGLELERSGEIIAELRTRGLLVRAELDDSPWSRQQKVIYLPLGPETDVERVIRIFIDSL